MAVIQIQNEAITLVADDSGSALPFSFHFPLCSYSTDTVCLAPRAAYSDDGITSGEAAALAIFCLLIGAFLQFVASSFYRVSIPSLNGFFWKTAMWPNLAERCGQRVCVF
jgi:hypothetical protein